MSTDLNGARIAAGSTVQYATQWKAYTPQCIYLDVDTAIGEFKRTPVYVTSISGKEEPWIAVGVSAIYPIPPALTPSPTGFRIYVRRVDGLNLTPEEANKTKGWYINWMGVEPLEPR